MNSYQSAVHSDGKALIFENRTLYGARNENKHLDNRTKRLILILVFGRMIANLPVWEQGHSLKIVDCIIRHYKN